MIRLLLEMLLCDNRLFMSGFYSFHVSNTSSFSSFYGLQHKLINLFFASVLIYLFIPLFTDDILLEQQIWVPYCELNGTYLYIFYQTFGTK